MIIRKHFHFWGWVQGVGFRYRARHAAELYGCTGWVRNDWDGTVSIESSSSSDESSSSQASSESSSEQEQGIIVGQRLEISGQEMYRINVFSITGKKVLTSYGNAIDLSSLPPGNYIVQLTGTTGSYLQKIYVQRTTF